MSDETIVGFMAPWAEGYTTLLQWPTRAELATEEARGRRWAFTVRLNVAQQPADYMCLGQGRDEIWITADGTCQLRRGGATIAATEPLDVGTWYEITVYQHHLTLQLRPDLTGRPPRERVTG